MYNSYSLNVNTEVMKKVAYCSDEQVGKAGHFLNTEIKSSQGVK